VKRFPHTYSYTTNDLLLILEKENKGDQKKVEKQPEDHKEINDYDYDYKRQADFEEEDDEEISGEG
jgi:hypothetical protein